MKLYILIVLKSYIMGVLVEQVSYFLKLTVGQPKRFLVGLIQLPGYMHGAGQQVDDFRHTLECQYCLRVRDKKPGHFHGVVAYAFFDDFQLTTI